MSQLNYSMFSKRHYNSRSNYNFESKKEHALAEKWFRERKELRQNLAATTATATATTALTAATATTALTTTDTAATTTVIKRITKGPPPGLTTKRQESCDIDLNIPSYDDFIYPDTLTHVTYPLESVIYF